MSGEITFFLLYFQIISIRSFALMQKNQKIKAYTPEATNSLHFAKISKTRTSCSNNRDFFTLSLEFVCRLFR